MQDRNRRRWIALGIITATVIYLLVRLIGLTKLPVFADESIYIRWAQLIIEDCSRYLFFPLNDGKTPLSIWLMVPQLKLGLATGNIISQLWCGRWTSVLIGWIQMIFLILTAIEFTRPTQPSLTKQSQPLAHLPFKNFWRLFFFHQQKKHSRDQLSTTQIQAAIATALLAIFLPIWFFYQRMALTDNLLCLTLIITLYCWLRCSRSSRDAISKFAAYQKTLSCKEKIKNHGWLITYFNPWLFLTGLAWGLGLWSKIPAILFAPMLLLLTFYPRPATFRVWRQRFIQFAITSLIALTFFYLLRFLSPAFSQLFSRGGDFLFSWPEIIQLGPSGLLKNFFTNLLEIIKIIHFYCGWSLFLLPLLAVIFCPSARRPQLLLLLSALAFAFPITLLGKVIYPRYYLPAFIPLTLMIGLSVPHIWRLITSSSTTSIPAPRRYFALIALGLASLSFAWLSFSFITTANINPDRLLLPTIDQTQYLGEWSSGHGINETTTLINQFIADPDHSLLVLTEGYFGTLPDALLMNFFGRNLPNFSLEGIGQPIYSIPIQQLARYQNFDQVWLVVNSHRLKLNLDSDQLLAEFCRPVSQICLQVWRLQ